MVITVNGMCGSVFPVLQFASQARSFKSQCSVSNIFTLPYFKLKWKISGKQLVLVVCKALLIQSVCCGRHGVPLSHACCSNHSNNMGQFCMINWARVWLNGFSSSLRFLTLFIQIAPS